MAGAEVQMKLIEAARYGSDGGVRFFIKRAGDVNWQDDDGWSAMHWAASKSSMECVELLLAAKARLDIENSAGDTALHIAARLGHIEVQRMLIKAGSSLKAINKDGLTPVDLAKSRA